MIYEEKLMYDQFVRDLHAATLQLNVAIESIREEEAILEVHVAHLQAIGDAYDHLRHVAKVVSIFELEKMRHELKMVKNLILESQLSIVSLKRYADDHRLMINRINFKIDRLLNAAKRGVVLYMPRRSGE